MKYGGVSSEYAKRVKNTTGRNLQDRKPRTSLLSVLPRDLWTRLTTQCQSPNSTLSPLLETSPPKCYRQLLTHRPHPKILLPGGHTNTILNFFVCVRMKNMVLSSEASIEEAELRVCFCKPSVAQHQSERENIEFVT